MNKNKKIIFTALISTVIIISIFIIYNNSSSKAQDNNIITSNQNIAKTITISERCRGCGKCVNIDPEHFTLNRTTKKSEVISQKNLNSNNLSSAIAMCPAGAITIN